MDSDLLMTLPVESLKLNSISGNVSEWGGGTTGLGKPEFGIGLRISTEDKYNASASSLLPKEYYLKDFRKPSEQLTLEVASRSTIPETY